MPKSYFQLDIPNPSDKKKTSRFSRLRNFFRKRKEQKRKLKAEKAKIKIELEATKNIISLPILESKIEIKNLFPNPFQREINLELIAEAEEDIQISMIDISGKIIYKNIYRVIKGMQKVQLFFENLSLEDGTYILQVREKNGQIYNRKIIKMEDGTLKVKSGS